MRGLPYIIALLGAAMLGAGCAEDPGELTSGDPSRSLKPDQEENEPPPAQTKPEHVPQPTSFADKTLARAREWIDADVPYCGGPNGGKDVICGGTCSRPDQKDWNDYRSDCSGFVSWAWDLPAPGRTTQTLAPYKTDISAVIDVADLEPGDALNGPGHVMLWGGWVDEKAGKALILQQSRCGQTAHEKTMTFTKVNETSLKASDGRVFRSIRYRS